MRCGCAWNFDNRFIVHTNAIRQLVCHLNQGGLCGDVSILCENCFTLRHTRAVKAAPVRVGLAISIPGGPPEFA
jgi:hypothetical protein